MSDGAPGLAGHVPLGLDEFERLRALIYRVTGISLGDGKRDLVAGRLARRLRHHALSTYADYLRLLDEGRGGGEELVELVNCITTNKTDFFREPYHFEMLRQRLVPRLVERAAHTGNRQVRVWSAGCSTGEEPYTIAMALHDVLPAADGWDVRVMATDIDTTVLHRGAAGRYTPERVGDVPAYARPCFQREGRDVRVRADIRALVQFRHLNLIAPAWNVDTRFDVIFCRNVVIYFDRPTQARLFERFAGQLRPDGHLFIGHSESLTGVSERYRLVGQTVYELGAGAPAVTSPSVPASAPALVRTSPRRPPPARGSTPARAMSGPAPAPPRRIGIGELVTSATPAHLTTVLGSCVSACLFDKVTGVGGMNHFLLPTRPAGSDASPRYGEVSLPQLIDELIELGADPRRLEAKLFGAGAVITGLSAAIGDANARFARELLASRGIPIVAERLGGQRPLELHFLTSTGTVLFRELANATEALAAAELEAIRLAELVTSPPSSRSSS